MINRELLAKTIKSTVIVSYFMPFVLAPFTLVVWVISAGPDGAAPAFALGAFGVLGFIILAFITLSPLILRPLMRQMLGNLRRRAAEHPELMAAKPEVFIPMHAQLLHMIWDLSAGAGFLAFIFGYGWVCFAAAAAMTLIGFVVDFPKREAILQWADEYDAEVALKHPPAAL